MPSCQGRKATIPLLILLVSLVFLPSCTTTETVKHELYQKPFPKGASIVLMEPDIECSAVTASGIPEPHAAWTEQAQRHVRAAVRDLLTQHGAHVVEYDPTAIPADHISRYREITKLYEVVGFAILTRAAFPTTKAKQDWTLGPGLQIVRDDQGADYALFVFVRDQYETAGRTAARLAWAILGATTTPATQRGFASLVDLRTGDIVWFNQLFSTVGDIRESEAARESVERLLEGCPAL